MKISEELEAALNRYAFAAALADMLPPEPLIKDEKVRKAVRAWADAMEIETVEFDEYWQSFRIDDATIGFKNLCGYLYLKNGEKYTITELCGEEE